ncbi:GFA family protein [Leisingera sp. JC11]|uniref:GFA family protein n=1 Tax=Leisingera sp. JC11 TaxID=3042469 RepID=UPI003453FC44
MDPLTGQFQGRMLNTLGDGYLIEFASAAKALEWAVRLQEGLIKRNQGLPEDQRIQMRISLNLGEILIGDSEAFGDGINIAARMLGVTEPGGIAVSQVIKDLLPDPPPVSLADLGAHKFKNISRGVHIWHTSVPGGSAPANVQFRPFVDMPSEPRTEATGGCMCGAVRYRVTEKELGSMLCHCRMCQKFSGAPVLGGTTYPASAVEFTKGQPKFYQPSKIAQRGFCENCGTALLYQGLVGQWTEWTMIFTASLDNPQDFPPTYHLGVESRMPWLDIHDDLPRTECKDSPSLIQAYHAVGEEVP